MKLHVNLAPLVVTGLFLLSMVGLRESAYLGWLAEQGPAVYMAPAAPPAVPNTIPVFPGAVGDAAGGMDICYDSLTANGGPYTAKVFKASSSDTSSGASLKAIFRDSLPAYPDHRLKVVEIIKDTLHITYDPGGAVTTMHSSCVIIAGQTAQGGGLYTRNRGIYIGPVGSDTPKHVLVAYATTQDGSHGVYVLGGVDIYLHHLTARWNALGGGQHNFSIGDQGNTFPWPTTDRVTMHASLMYEPNSAHPTNWRYGAGYSDSASISNVTGFQNAFMGAGYRGPLAGPIGTMTEAQSVFFNWRDRATDAENQRSVNLMGLFHHSGPATSSGSGKNLPYFFGDICSSPVSADSVCLAQHYVRYAWFLGSDTVLPTQATYDYWRSTGSTDSIISCRQVPTSNHSGDTDDGYMQSKASPEYCPSLGGAVPLSYKSSSFITHSPDWTYPPDTTGLDSAIVEAVIATAGNSQRLNCVGEFVTRRDGFDSSRVAWFRNRWLGLGGMEGLNSSQTTGIVDDGATGGIVVPGNPLALGGDSIAPADYSPAVGTPCADTDNDGLFDDWETATGETDPDADPDGDGWTNLMEFLNGSEPNVFTDPGGFESGGSTPAVTYGDDRIVHLVRIRIDTIPYNGGVDTQFVRFPDSIDADMDWNWVTETSGQDTALVLTYDTAISQPWVLDSAEVDSVATDWGISESSIRTRSVPGEP